MDRPPHSSQPADVRRVAFTTVVVLSVALGFGAAVWVLYHLSHMITYLTVALFFTVVLTPAVDFLQHRGNMRRGLATVLVFVVGLVAISGMTYAFVRPLVDQGQKFADELPQYLKDAERGRGTAGKLVKQFKLQSYFKKNSTEFRKSIGKFGSKGFTVARGVFTGIVAAVTVMVLTILMLLQGPLLSTSALKLIPDKHRTRVLRVAGDSAKAVSGYMFGNVVISLIAGAATYVFLLIAGVPYAEVLALWVAFADLIPLVGATLGAVPAVAIAFIHSTPTGIATVIFFVTYQQFENHVLQLTIMARTVKLNPLGVLVSVLVGVELFGFLGALLAIPAAGVLQVIIRDVYDHHQAGLEATAPGQTIAGQQTEPGAGAL